MELLNSANRWFFRHFMWFAVLGWLICFCLTPPALCIDTLCLTLGQIWATPTIVSPFISYILARPLAALGTHFPMFAYLPLYLTILSLLTLIVFARILVSSPDGKIGFRNWAGLIIVSMHIYKTSHDMHFHFIGYAAAAAGLIVILSGSSRRPPIQYFFGLLLFTAGIALRFDAMPVVISAIAALISAAILKRDKCCIFRLIAPLAVTLFLFSTQYRFANTQMWEAATDTPVQNFIDVNKVRASFCDFKDPHGSEKQEEYLQYGFTPNDAKLFEAFIVLHRNRSLPGWMEQIGSIRRQNNETIPRSISVLRARIDDFLKEKQAAQHRKALILTLAMQVFVMLIPFPSSWKDERIWLLASVILLLMTVLAMGRANDSAAVSISNLHLPLACLYMPMARSTSAVRNLVSLILLAGCTAQCIRKLAADYAPFEQRPYSPELRGVVEAECTHNAGTLYLWDDPKPSYVPRYSIRSKDYRPIVNITLTPRTYASMFPSYQKKFKDFGIESDRHAYHSPNVRFICKSPSLDYFDLIQSYEKEQHAIKLNQEVEKELAPGYYLIRTIAEPIETSNPTKQ